MSTLSTPRRSVQPRSRRPVVAELTLTVNGTPYQVLPIAPGPDNTRAVRLVKDGNADSVYDCCLTNGRILQCNCPDFEARSGNQVGYRCKHLTALVMVGLVEAPKVEIHNRDNITVVDEAPAVAPLPDEFDEPARVDPYTSALTKMTALAEAELVVRAEGRAEHAAKVAELVAVREAEGRPAPVPAFDRAWHLSMNAVVEKRAEWLTSKPVKGIATNDTPAEPRLVDDDGSILETSAEMAARHREEQAAKVLALMEGNLFVPAAREVELVPCCDPAESMPCQSCVNVHTLPDDLSGDDWEDGHRYELGPDDAPASADEPAPDPRSLADQVDVEARHYRTLGTAFGDLIARHLAELADRVRFLGATTTDDYQDRHQALLDSVRTEAEARDAARR